MASSLLKAPLEGWSKELVNDKLIYTPSDLQAGMQFSYIALPIEKLGQQNLREWFIFRISQLQNELGKPDKKWAVNSEEDGSLSVSNTYMSQSEEVLSVGYNGIPLVEGSVFIIQMLASNDLGVLMQYGSDYYEILKDAGNTLLAV